MHREDYFNQWIAKIKTGDYSEVISDISEFIKLNQNCAEAYGYRGNALTKKKEFDKAISDYSKAIELNPRYVRFFLFRGLVYYEQSNYDAAISDLTKAIEMDSKNAEAYLIRGTARFYKKDPVHAYQDLKKSGELGYKIAAETIQKLFSPDFLNLISGIDGYLYSGGDGSTFQNAIVIKDTIGTIGIRAEYEYIIDKFGEKDTDWKLNLQKLTTNNNRTYDIIEISLSDGAKKEIYFDITNFYGK